MLNGLKHKWRSAEAAALIESTLEEMARNGTFDGDPKALGFKLVQGASQAHPELFDGRNGHRPHRVSYAATVLSLTAERAPADSMLYPVVMICLGTILRVTSDFAVTLPFSPQDLMLIEGASETFAKLAQRDEQQDFS